MAKRVPKTLYHYCSLPTFYSIVNSESIWLSDIGKSNDSLELKWIKGRCQYHILKAWVDYAKEVSNIKDHVKIDFEKFDELQKSLEILTTNETERCWAFCLSEKKDALGQWRGYAEDGTGISIGFKTTFFTKMMESKTSTKDPADPYRASFDYVSYDEREVEKLFYDGCGLSSITSLMSSKEVIHILKKAIVASLLLSPFYKSEAFAEEKEWRLVFSTVLSELKDGRTPVAEFAQLFPQNTIQYDFIARNGDLVSHIAIEDKTMFKNISEIWIGPKCKLSQKDLKLFLISKGYIKNFDDNSINIYKSSSSYR